MAEDRSGHDWVAVVTYDLTYPEAVESLTSTVSLDRQRESKGPLCIRCLRTLTEAGGHRCAGTPEEDEHGEG